VANLLPPLAKKSHTAAGLLARGRIDLFARQARSSCRSLRLRMAQGPFVYRRNGVRFAAFPDNPASREQYAADFDDTFELAIWRRWLAPGDLAIDAGCHLGLFSAAAAVAVGDFGHVLAVDADRSSVDNVNRAAKLLGYTGVHGVHAAVGNRQGEAEFFLASAAGGTQAMQSLVPADDCYQPVPVALRTLADLAVSVRGTAPAQGVKLDLEGAELLALQGAPSSWFAADGPLWVVEINAGALARFHTTPADILRWFDSGSFEMWLVPHYCIDGGSRAPRPLAAKETFADALFYNLLAIPTQNVSRRRRIAQFFG